MKKFILALCAVMLLMFSCTALADGSVSIDSWWFDDSKTVYCIPEEYSLKVVKPDDNWTVKVQGGNPMVITLRNLDANLEASPQRSLTPSGGYIFSYDADVNLVLEGSNRIEAKTWDNPVLGIDGNLTVSGSGSLEIVQNYISDDGNDVPFGTITVNGKIAMNSGSIDVSFSEDIDNFGEKDRATGIIARDIDMQGGKMRAEGMEDGIEAYGGDINVSGGEMYGEAYWAGIFANNGNINVTGGKVEGYALDDADGVGILSNSYPSEATVMSLDSGSFGGLINANGMNIYSLDGGQNAGKIGTIEEEDFRASAVFAMNEDVENGAPAHHALIVAPIPATGDEANLILWVGMLVVAGFALIYMKKRYA